MAPPSDQSGGEESADISSSEMRGTAKKVGIIDPGFRQESDDSVLQPRLMGIKTPANPSDRRNLFYLGIALLVALIIFAVLEYKDLREAAREAKHAAKEMIQGQ